MVRTRDRCSVGQCLAPAQSQALRLHRLGIAVRVLDLAQVEAVRVGARGGEAQDALAAIAEQVHLDGPGSVGDHWRIQPARGAGGICRRLTSFVPGQKSLP